MKNNKGFSILELLIAIAISIILMSAIYYTYTTFFMGIKSERVSVEQEIEKIVGLELLRLDLEHLGYGVGINPYESDYKIFEINNNGKELIIRTTLNNTRNETIGWRICKVKKEKKGNYVAFKKDYLEKNNNNFVYVNDKGVVSYLYYGKDKKIYDRNGTVICDDKSSNNKCPNNCPKGDDAIGVFIGYPFCCGSNCNGNCKGCNFGGIYFCTEVKYSLSEPNSPNLPKNCHPNTYNLLRKVNDDNGKPLLSCVADIKFTAEVLDKNGKVVTINDTSDTNLDSNEIETLRTVKKINVYILYQEATPPDPKYRFKEYDGTDSKGSYIEVDNQRLYLPSNFERYKWKVIKLSVKPMSVIR
ncbi:MAG: hypothetical protein DSY66_03120 [Persephonella sp.]|nr:MAG: hypothetical protein DSY66_03120 [Persephonella sp.]